MMNLLVIHNVERRRFVYLWAKYVKSFNPEYHCTNCLKGPYSKKLRKKNPELDKESTITFDEVPLGAYRAIYICGVAQKGYSRKRNYPHNLHTAILPSPGAMDRFSFENWKMVVENGRFLRIPGEEDLPEEYKDYSEEYTSCRIFRWGAVCFHGGTFDPSRCVSE